MENLTKMQDIVREVGDPRPIPGYSLVVFREENGGRVFYEVVGSRESFRPGLWDRYKYQFVAYAVSDDPELRYRFSHQLFFWDSERVHPYTVEIALLFRAADPGTLAEKLTSDPLRRLRNEIQEVLKLRAADIPYNRVRDDEFDLQKALLQNGKKDQKTVDLNQTPFERLQALATTLGFHLRKVEIERNPTPDEIDLTKHERDEKNKQEKRAQTHKSQVKILQQEGEIEYLRALNDQQAQAVKRVTKLLDEGAKQLGEALKNIALNTDSAASLRETMRQFVDLRRELAGGLLGVSHGDASPAGPSRLTGGIVRGLPSSEAAVDPLSQEIEKMRSSLDKLDCRPSELRTLAARILHLLAELSLGEEADEDHLQSYAKVLRQYCESIQLGSLIQTAEQHQYFQRLRDLPRMRRVFSSDLVQELQKEEVVDG